VLDGLDLLFQLSFSLAEFELRSDSFEEFDEGVLIE